MFGQRSKGSLWTQNGRSPCWQTDARSSIRQQFAPNCNGSMYCGVQALVFSNGQILYTKILNRPEVLLSLVLNCSQPSRRLYITLLGCFAVAVLVTSPALHHSPGLLRGCCTRDIAVLFEAGILANGRSASTQSSCQLTLLHQS